MNHKSVLLQVSSLFLILVFLVACNTPQPSQTYTTPTEETAPSITLTPTATETPADEVEIKQIVRKAGKVVPDPEKDAPLTLKIEDSKDGETRYIYEQHDIVENIDNIMYLGLNDDIIWPGSLVKGDKVDDFIYEPIAVKRAPIMLSVSLESSLSTGSSITQRVDNPTLSTVRQGISDLLKKAIVEDTRVPAKVDFNYQQIYNESQLNLFLGADIKYGGAKLSANFNWDSTTKKTKIMARYRQIYYSVDVDHPMNPADFIAPTMTATQLRAVMPSGSNPMYIASVSYGMMALIFIETDASEENIKAALEAGYSGVVDVNIEGELTAKEILENSSIKIIVYGGSTTDLKNLETGYAGFKKVIEASSDFGIDTPGVPLLYKFRHLADNTLALTTLTSQYTLVKSVQLVQRVKINLDEIKIEGRSVSIVKDFSINLSAYNNSEGILSPIGEVTQIYSSTGWIRHPRDKMLDINTTSSTFYIKFNTDPDLYDYKDAAIDIFGYVNYEYWFKNNNVSGLKTIIFRDFLENEGQHTFSIPGSDFNLKVTLTIEIED